MQSFDLMLDGLNLMLYGMGFVFIFLTLLVFTTKAMSSIINKWFVPPEPDLVPPPPVSPALPPAQLAADDPHILAVLSAAVHLYRQGKQT